MNVLLQSMERDGYVIRPAEAPVGKALPARLTPAGRRNLAKATVAVRSVEKRMLSGLSDQDESDARRILSNLVASLGQPDGAVLNPPPAHVLGADSPERDTPVCPRCPTGPASTAEKLDPKWR
jgi:hypothetical protein